jgi:hypothetical protein
MYKKIIEICEKLRKTTDVGPILTGRAIFDDP